jgi:hypothetical protein
LNEGKVKTINPTTEEVLNEYKIMTKEQINDKVKKAQMIRRILLGEPQMKWERQ